MKKFTEWLENDAEDCGIMTPPMDAQLAVDMLTDYLLGEDWYSISGATSAKQINTEMVFAILMRHSKKFRKEWKKFRKEKTGTGI